MKTFGGILLIGLGIWLSVVAINQKYYLARSQTQEIEVASSTSSDLVINTSSSLPKELLIPKIDVKANVQHLGVTQDGNMAAPNNFSDVSWYKYGTVPGGIGSAVMAGHDNGIYVRGVFKRLNELRVGDDVYIEDGNGQSKHFKVVETAIYPYDNAPLEKIFNTSDSARLNLITCTGEWNEDIGSSDHRLVVYTKLVN